MFLYQQTIDLLVVPRPVRLDSGALAQDTRQAEKSCQLTSKSGAGRATSEIAQRVGGNRKSVH